LQSLVLLVFVGVNLYGVGAAGRSEDLIVLVKLLFLILFAAIGLTLVDWGRLSPVFERGVGGTMMGAALIFVAYEGFELIPNAVQDMEDPTRDLPRGLYLSIGTTAVVYVSVALVAVGNLTPADIREHGEYALAVAAEPFLGQAGFVLVCLAALFSAASAINATLFGSARLSLSMAKEEALPAVFNFRRRMDGPPSVALVVIGAATLVFVNSSGLGTIASFASSTFLLTFAAVNVAGFKLRHKAGIRGGIPLLGLLLCAGSWLVLMSYLARSDPASLWRIGGVYLVALTAELLYSKRRCIFQPVASRDTTESWRESRKPR